MAAKLFHSLTDDNPDLQRQIGCMTGIFQLFDRHQIISARRLRGLSPKRLPSGSSRVYGGNSETESNSLYHQPTAKEKILTKYVNEKQRLSIESSQSSFSSSSRSSSFSSLDGNMKTNQLDPSPYDQVIFPETPSRDPGMSQPSTLPQYTRSSLDFRDVVKDSIYRDTVGIPVKNTIKEEQSDHLTKLKDSPTQTLPVDLKQSLRVLAEIQEAPWYCDERGEHPRSSFESKSGSVFSVPKDALRFSCDGREVIPSTQKQKELPRLSLDSRESSMRSFSSYSKSNSLFPNYFQERGNLVNRTSGPSVVAKLMGLETLPCADTATDSRNGSIRSFSGNDSDPFLRSSKPNVVPVLNSSMNPWMEPASPRRKTNSLVMKPVSNSRFPIEPAPWKQHFGSQGLQKLALGQVSSKPTSSFPSVHNEIEKRLKYLEFTQSGKDLRALKQILETMQTKGLLDNNTEREGLCCNFANQRDMRPTNSKSQTIYKLDPHSDLSQLSRAYESPIVIMKPAKLVAKSSIPSSSSVIPMDRLSGFPKFRGDQYVSNQKASANNRASKEQVPKTSVRENSVNACFSDYKRMNNRPSKSAQYSIQSQNLSRDNIMSTVKGSAYVRTRLQQRKPELERRSRPPISPDSNKKGRQQIKNEPESNYPGGRHRLKTVNLQANDDQSREVNSKTKMLRYQEDDTVVTSSESFSKTSCSQNPSLKAKFAVSSSSQQRFVPKLSEDGEMAELGIVTPEQPSPVSVLDDTMYDDDALSPVKQIPDVLQDEATVPNNVDREEQNIAEDLMSNTTINRKKLENIKNLVQKLRRLNSTHDEAQTDYIASLCENTNPDHRYISEILLASGLLLRDLSSSLSMLELHPSGYPINPELFFVLEQTKQSTLEKEQSGSGEAVRTNSDKEKFHRKLIFDTVNEILLKKMTTEGSTSKLVRRPLNAQKLLKDLCFDIQNLQMEKLGCVVEAKDDNLKCILWEDVMNRWDSWVDINGGDLSRLVLDVERLIFKDLVSEIAHGEAVGTEAGRQCRQLFA